MTAAAPAPPAEVLAAPTDPAPGCACGGGPAIAALPGRDGRPVWLCGRCVDHLVRGFRDALLAKAKAAATDAA